MANPVWQFIKSEATINLITNPSFETNTTGWTAGSGTLARSAEQQAVGIYSGKYTPAAGTTDGAYYAITLGTSTTYTFALSFHGVNGIPYRIRIRNQSNGVDVGSNLQFTGAEAWRRQVLTFTTSPTGTSYRLFVEKDNSASTGAYYVDAVQLEQQDHASTYCDGDQRDCTWTGPAHASTSQRSAQAAAGGRVTDLTTTSYLQIQDHVGVGTPPMEIIDTLPAQGDGGDYQRTIARPRQYQFIGVIEGTGSDAEAARLSYHQKRTNLITAFTPHRLATDQPVGVRYKYNGKSLQLESFYEGGLEKGPMENAHTEKVTLRLKAEDPYFRRVMGAANGDWGAEQGGKSLGVQQSLTVRLLAQRDATGTWSGLGPPNAAGTYTSVLALAEDATYIYIGGNFLNFDNIANADHIVRYNKSTGAYSALGTGMNGMVEALAIMPNGDLIAAGSFTLAGGVANTAYIARWNGSAWVALGTGLSDRGRALAVMPNGDLIVGGNFALAGGVANTARIARWNGSAWLPLSTGLNGTVRSLAVMPSGDLIAGGEFANAGGVAAADGIAGWDGSAWFALSTGTLGTPYTLAVTPGGILIAGGDFASAGGVADTARIAQWNGSSWAALGTGVTGEVYSLAALPDGGVIASGDITIAGGLTLPDRVAFFNGSTWLPLADIDLPGTPIVYAILPHSDGKLTLGFTTTGTAIAGVTTTVTNAGTAKTYPTLIATGPGRLYQLTNYTTGKAIYFDLSLVTGETVTLTLDPNNLAFESSFRGNITASAILGGSDQDDFVLAVGDNSMSLLIDDATATAVMLWDELYQSFDGVV
jgi:hypothetical protein